MKSNITVERNYSDQVKWESKIKSKISPYNNSNQVDRSPDASENTSQD